MGTWSARKWMLFVDGENLTIRGQEFASANTLKLTEGPYFKKDAFLWMANARPLALPDYNTEVYALEECGLRSYYYTSVVGSTDVLDDVEQRLWTIGFTPKVFKKQSQERKSKGVDIALCTDMLTHAFQNHFDAAILLAGDGDYRPLIGRVKSLGKIVFVWFFTNQKHGLNPKLKIASDQFLSLDSQFVRNWPPPAIP
jgi:uncharacterized LabA/DUF88 family protein